MLSSQLRLSKTSSPLHTERIELMEVYRPYLTARGQDPIDESITPDVLKQHFESEVNGAKVEYVEIKKGNVAEITFINPQGILITVHVFGIELVEGCV